MQSWEMLVQFIIQTNNQITTIFFEGVPCMNSGFNKKFIIYSNSCFLKNVDTLKSADGIWNSKQRWEGTFKSFWKYLVLILSILSYYRFQIFEINLLQKSQKTFFLSWFWGSRAKTYFFLDFSVAQIKPI